MEGIDVFYITVVFCLIFAAVSAYLIYQYVQEERRVAAKMRLKKEFEKLDPSTYAKEEARNRGAYSRAPASQESTKPGNRVNGQPGNWVNGQPGNCVNGQPGNSVVPETKITSSGIPVLQMSEDGKLVPVTEGENNQRVTTGYSQRAATEYSQRAATEHGQKAATGHSQRAAIEHSQRETSIKSKQNTNREQHFTPSQNASTLNSTMAGGLAVATIAAVANKNQTHPARHHYRDDNDLRLDLYNESYDEAVIEPKPLHIVGPSAMVVAQATVPKNRGVLHADDVNNNTSVFHVANENHQYGGGPQRAQRKKKVARLLQPIEGVSDFDDYRNQSQKSTPPPPGPASYSIPTPVMEQDRKKIMVDYENKSRKNLPRAIINSGMNF